MPKADNKRPSATATRRAHPYTLPSARSSMPSASENMGHRHTESNASDRHSAIPWTAHNDDQLMRARQQGMNWQPIADKYFPDKTANACRKRHERLMEKRNANGAWNGVKFEEVAKAYVEVREEMWRMVAERVGERSWQLIESKCMEKGVKNLSSMGRAASRKERMAPNGHLEHDINDDGALCVDTHSGNEAIAEEQHPFSADSDSSRRTTISNVSTASFPHSLPPPIPALRNFSSGYSNTSLPGISSIVGPSGLPVTTH
ncbi:MAG: hypothetical protein Q9218_000537 [Villophora microphyllina]